MNFIETVFSPARLFTMASDFDSYKLWLSKVHRRGYDEKIMKGHRFFLECAFTSIFHSFIGPGGFALKRDKILEDASTSTLCIEKMPGTSERQLILKALFLDYTGMINSKDEIELKLVTQKISSALIGKLVKFYNSNYRVSKKVELTRDRLDQIILIDALLIYFTQINNSGPYAHQGALLHEYWIPQEKMVESLEGYLYIIQYLYSIVLPEDLFKRAQLDKMHTSDSWRKYVYNEPEPDDIDLTFILGRTFDINKQTCFESYFYRLNDLLEVEIPKRFGISHVGPEVHLIAKKSTIPKSLIKNLINPSVRKHNKEMNIKEKLDFAFRWEQIEVPNITSVNNSISIASFITLLKGSFADSGKEKVLVNKYRHEVGKKRSEYSYAVLFVCSQTNVY